MMGHFVILNRGTKFESEMAERYGLILPFKGFTCDPTKNELIERKQRMTHNVDEVRVSKAIAKDIVEAAIEAHCERYCVDEGDLAVWGMADLAVEALDVLGLLRIAPTDNDGHETGPIPIDYSAPEPTSAALNDGADDASA